jgi:hypothetical protein
MAIETEIIEGELVPYEEPAAPLTLFGTRDPRVALQRMSDVATALVDVIDSRKLYATINGRKHITVEGWTTLAGMLGVVPVVTGTRANDTGDGIVATVEARTLDGRVVGAAEGECSRAESKWRNRDPFAIRSMAQTRAISRALRAPLGQIIVLAGYEPAAAEELPHEDRTAMKMDSERARPTLLQQQQIRALFARLATAAPDIDWAGHCREAAGMPTDELTKAAASSVIEQMRAWLSELEGDHNA